MADNSWGTSELAAALPDAKNGHANGTEHGSIKGDEVQEEQKAALLEKARAAGWVDRQAYNYDEYRSTAGTDWESNARIYEWDGETGEVGPELPELELELFGDPNNRMSAGIDFSKLVPTHSDVV